MLITLYIWAALTSNQHYETYGWVPRGEFHSVELCQKAISQLGVETNRARCIITKEK